MNWTTKALAALSGRVIAKEQLPELSEARQWYDSSRSFSRAMLFAAVLYLLLARYNHESEGVRVPYARSFSTMHRPANLFPSSPSGFCDVGVISFKVRVSDPSLDFFCSIFYFSHWFHFCCFYFSCTSIVCAYCILFSRLSFLVN